MKKIIISFFASANGVRTIDHVVVDWVATAQVALMKAANLWTPAAFCDWTI